MQLYTTEEVLNFSGQTEKWIKAEAKRGMKFSYVQPVKSVLILKCFTSNSILWILSIFGFIKLRIILPNSSMMIRVSFSFEFRPFLNDFRCIKEIKTTEKNHKVRLILATFHRMRMVLRHIPHCCISCFLLCFLIVLIPHKNFCLFQCSSMNVKHIYLRWKYYKIPEFFWYVFFFVKEEPFISIKVHIVMFGIASIILNTHLHKKYVCISTPILQLIY